jgi:large subunit ribosomal protein L12
MEYVYAALLLHKLGKPVDEQHIKKVMEAAGASVDEAKVKVLLASLAGVDINKELENASMMSVAAAGASSGASGAKVEEEKKEEVKTEAAAEGLSALFS